MNDHMNHTGCTDHWQTEIQEGRNCTHLNPANVEFKRTNKRSIYIKKWHLKYIYIYAVDF